MATCIRSCESIGEINYRNVILKDLIDVAVKGDAESMTLLKSRGDASYYAAVTELTNRCAAETANLLEECDKALSSAEEKGSAGCFEKILEERNKAVNEINDRRRVEASNLSKIRALEYDLVLYYAAAYGRVEVFQLIKDWGATDFDRALAEAALGGRIEAMILLKTWGATDYNWALKYAASAGQLEAMVLLKQWGATDYEESIYKARTRGELEAELLLENWVLNNSTVVSAKLIGNMTAAVRGHR